MATANDFSEFVSSAVRYYTLSYIDEEEIAMMATTLDKLINGHEQKVWQMYETDPEDESPTFKGLIWYLFATDNTFATLKWS